MWGKQVSQGEWVEEGEEHEATDATKSKQRSTPPPDGNTCNMHAKTARLPPRTVTPTDAYNGILYTGLEGGKKN